MTILKKLYKGNVTNLSRQKRGNRIQNSSVACFPAVVNNAFHRIQSVICTDYANEPNKLYQVVSKTCGQLKYVTGFHRNVFRTSTVTLAYCSEIVLQLDTYLGQMNVRKCMSAFRKRRFQVKPSENLTVCCYFLWNSTQHISVSFTIIYPNRRPLRLTDWNTVNPGVGT